MIPPAQTMLKLRKAQNFMHELIQSFGMMVLICPDSFRRLFVLGTTDYAMRIQSRRLHKQLIS